MRDDLQSKLVEILTSIQGAVGKAYDFTIEQLPDIAQSYVAWGRALHTMEFSLSVLCLIAGLVGCYWTTFKSKAVDFDNCWTIGRIIGCIVAGSTALISLIATSSTLPAFLMVWFAPKVWLLKEIAGLVR
jgi:hypothetical protein